MNFTKIILENVFAYYGTVELDLSGCDDSRNIIIVSGRNGMGKTSLLNAVKLLFLGVNDDRLRKVGFPPNALGPVQYIRGKPGLWSGLINARAQRENLDRARVSIIWNEGDKKIEAERAWQLNGPSYTETLSMYIDGEAVSPEEAGRRLADTLPKDFVPFFFFDGEQIQALAEAEEQASAREIERVLAISFVNELQHEVDEFIKNRKRDALSKDTQVAIKRAEGRLTVAQAERDSAGDRLIETQNEIHDLESRKRQLESERDEIRGGVSEAERELLKKRLENIENQRAELARSIAEELPVEVPFLVDFATSRTAFEEIDSLVSERAAHETRIIELLREELPAKLLLREPFPKPKLKPAQIDQLAKKLDDLLVEYTRADSSHLGRFPSLDLATAQGLRDRFMVWARNGMSRREAFATSLKRMRHLTVQRDHAKEEIARASVASEGAIARFKEIASNLQEIENTLVSMYEQMGKIEAEIEQTEKLIEATKREVQELEGQYEQQKTVDQTVSYARRASNVLNDYRNRLRENRRESVERKINEKLSILLADHRQIAKVRLNDNFIMTFFDADENQVGRSSISAGMKQLIATALIWALKDESGANLPVIIDTPLARIDKRNRQRLLDEYYPNAGGQVIILPTDSEIDDEHLMQMSPYVARRYMIQNPDGENADFDVTSDFGEAKVG